MSYNCQYCKNNFKSKYSLGKHQKNAKYCLKLRTNKKENLCLDCSSVFANKRNLQKHREICIKYISNKYENKLQRLIEKNIIDKDIIKLNHKKELKNKDKNNTKIRKTNF